MLPTGRIVPGLVPIVKEFDRNLSHEWRSRIWEDGRQIFRVENMVEREGLIEAFDTDPTPARCCTLQYRYVYSGHLQTIQYGG